MESVDAVNHGVVKRREDVLTGQFAQHHSRRRTRIRQFLQHPDLLIGTDEQSEAVSLESDLGVTRCDVDAATEPRAVHSFYDVRQLHEHGRSGRADGFDIGLVRVARSLGPRQSRFRTADGLNAEMPLAALGQGNGHGLITYIVNLRFLHPRCLLDGGGQRRDVLMRFRGPLAFRKIQPTLAKQFLDLQPQQVGSVQLQRRIRGGVDRFDERGISSEPGGAGSDGRCRRRHLEWEILSLVCRRSSDRRSRSTEFMTRCLRTSRAASIDRWRYIRPILVYNHFVDRQTFIHHRTDLNENELDSLATN